MASESLVMGGETKTPTESKIIDDGNCPLIKPSLSMISLPPNEKLPGEDLKPKLRNERPYNSLKKKRISKRDSWRNSWGSGHSYQSLSSCSLYSNTAGFGLSSGKDDFWAALQTNYNYIMDTNLMDTCHETRCELELETQAIVNTSECCSKKTNPEDGHCPKYIGLKEKGLVFLDIVWINEKTIPEDGHCPKYIGLKRKGDMFLFQYRWINEMQQHHTEESPEDLKGLRRWLREKEETLAKSPTLFEAARMTTDQLGKLLTDHSVIYYDIVSHARVVNAFLRGSTSNKEQPKIDIKSNSDNRASEENLKALERRYHLLYLKAFEIQCLFEGLLGKRNSSTFLNRTSSVETDDEPAFKIARYADGEVKPLSNVHNARSFDNQKDLVSRERNLEDKDDNRHRVRQKSHRRYKHYSQLYKASREPNGIDFDADSEDSDFDNNDGRKLQIGDSDKNEKIRKQDRLPTNGTMEMKHLTERQMAIAVTDEILNAPLSLCNSAVSLRTSTIVSLCKAGIRAPTSKKRQKIADTSKFNRSNRKSKNCAIFYFKHLDTDIENFGSETNKSAGPSSDEGWLYSTDFVDVVDEGNNGSDKENSMDNSIGKLQPSRVSNITKREDKEDVIYICKTETMEEAVSMDYFENPTVQEEDSIRQLVSNAENLIREDIVKTPTKKQTIVQISSTVKKREISMPGPHLQKVQEWLEHQPCKVNDPSFPQATTDCEASGEYTESDSSNARESDTSDAPSDSVATCMQTGESNSQCTSTEKICGSTEPFPYSGSNLSLGCSKVVRRTNKRNCDRPWSVSCLSQLTENDKINGVNVSVKQGLTTHSISESALHILSVANSRNHCNNSIKTSGSKGSLRRRKPRKRKVNKKSDSGSDGIIQKLFEQQSSTCNVNIVDDVTETFFAMSFSKKVSSPEKSLHCDSEEEALTKPNFQIGAVTNVPFPLSNESKLGPLAALGNYMNEDQTGNNTGTEDHSSFSEQAWDNFQEKYNSENYSEGMDSDAARRLLEFGDDYRNFLDSQSDCCSSLSAANNVDSLSPPQMDSLNTNEKRLPKSPPISTIDHMRRRRALELEYDRRRENKKKSSNDELRGTRSPTSSILSTHSASRCVLERNPARSFNEVVRRLDFQSNSPHYNLKKSSESESNSNRRRKSEESSTIRRRISRVSDKAIRISSVVSSSSNSSSDEEKEVKILLVQSRNRLEDTNSLRSRSHLLRQEDYNEILSTCRGNIDCLASVLQGASGALSTACNSEARDVLGSWEHLLRWSENAAAVRKMQEEMFVIKNALEQFGKLTCDMDSEVAIQLSIEELKREKTQLQTFRANMLRINASVHSWLTKEEIRNNQQSYVNIAEYNKDGAEGNNVKKSTDLSSADISNDTQSEKVYFINLRNDVSDMYSAWDKADARVSNQLEKLTNSLIAWKQLESGLSEFYQVLGEDRGILEGLECALDRSKTNGSDFENNVKLVARLLSEKVAPIQHQVAMIASEQVGQGKQFHTIVTSSNGSLSDSGMSDGGATSDGGFSERERRLVMLRRLARQLENALAPGSEALRSIAARMESAELELKMLQNTCRNLIVRSNTSQHNIGLFERESAINSSEKSATKVNISENKNSSLPKRNIKRKTSTNISSNDKSINSRSIQEVANIKTIESRVPRDDSLQFTVNNNYIDEKKRWSWRIARIALPLQVAIITLFCAACLMEPHCCDTLNNFSMSLAPQLRYIRGPPPV